METTMLVIAVVLFLGMLAAMVGFAWLDCATKSNQKAVRKGIKVTLKGDDTDLPGLMTRIVDANGVGIAGIKVWVTSDDAGRDIHSLNKTDEDGVVTFRLLPGEYCVWSEGSLSLRDVCEKKVGGHE